MREYERNPEMKEMIDQMFDRIKSEGVARFGPDGTPAEAAESGFMENNPTFDLRYCAPQLATKDILLIGGWDDRSVSIEQILLPLYRALINNNATHVTITAVQDDHSFRNTRQEVAEIITGWLNSE